MTEVKILSADSARQIALKSMLEIEAAQEKDTRTRLPDILNRIGNEVRIKALGGKVTMTYPLQRTYDRDILKESLEAYNE